MSKVFMAQYEDNDQSLSSKKSIVVNDNNSVSNEQLGIKMIEMNKSA